jgi:hypothetical protein
MWITYRRTGRGLGLMVVGLAVAVLTVAVAAVAVIAAAVLAPVAILARAMRPASRRHHRASAASPWPHETIEAAVVSSTRSSDERDLLRLDSDKG